MFYVHVYVRTYGFKLRSTDVFDHLNVLGHEDHCFTGMYFTGTYGFKLWLC